MLCQQILVDWTMTPVLIQESIPSPAVPEIPLSRCRKLVSRNQAAYCMLLMAFMEIHVLERLNICLLNTDVKVKLSARLRSYSMSCESRQKVAPYHGINTLRTIVDVVGYECTNVVQKVGVQ